LKGAGRVETLQQMSSSASEAKEARS